MKNHKVWQTFHALGAPIGFLLAFNITGSVLAQDQRGTDNLPFVVKTILEQKLPLHVHTSTDTDWWMFGVVLVVGLLQLCVFILQLCVFRYQAIQLRKTVEATQKYAETAREEMISAHPPKMIVRRIVTRPNIGDDDFQQGNELTGRFAVINSGRSKGKITDSYSIFFITYKALPTNPPYDIGTTSPRFNILLDTGFAKPLNITKGITINSEIINAVSSDSNWKLYVMGWIDYLDSMDRPVSRLFFCRAWSPRHNRFLPLDNPDYESEERVQVSIPSYSSG